MKSIIVTEKPSVARTFAQVLGVTNKENGYMENDKWIITWCLGHLVSLVQPEEIDDRMKQWSMDTLPFLPKEYKYDVIHDPEHRCEKQFNIIKKLYNRKDIGCIYYAGDPAREGIYIQMLVRNQAGHNMSAAEKVVWIDSQTPAEIKRGIKEAKPLSEYDNLTDAGYMRAIEDYAVGMNFSRAISLRYHSTLNVKRPIAVGRVMTCVLGMVVNREREIRAFEPKDFYRVQSTILVNGNAVTCEWKADPGTRLYNKLVPKMMNENSFKSEDFAKKFISHLGDVKIDSVEQKEEKKNAPLLFNLAELQATCSRMFHISPGKTLEIAQTLYTAQLTTYPRTDSRYLSSAIADVIDENLNGLLGYSCETDDAIRSISNPTSIKNTRYTNDAKVNDHYAIIPTGQNISRINQLTDIERKVYNLIVRRFVSIFLPAAIYKKINVSWRDNKLGELFVGSGSSLKSPGYLVLWGSNEEELNPGLMLLKSGDEYDSEYNIVPGKTTPPKRYTSGSMILAMENAGNLIEDEDLRAQIKGSGIGTSATRAETIKKLIRIGDILLNDKTQVITPTAYGECVYDVVKDCAPQLLNPKMTAEWEQELTEIADGLLSADDYRAKFEVFVTDIVSGIKSVEISDTVRAAAKNIPEKERDKPKTISAPVETYLNVPFEDKNAAKAAGAYFDGNKKMWYVPKGKDLSAFRQWIPEGGSMKSVKKILLRVPFADKDEAKRLGAKWDATKRCWYIYSTSDRSKFKKWLK